VSRLRSSEHVRKDKYHNEQLYDILNARAKWGSTDVIADDQLYRVADATAGDARLAMGILPIAATTTDRENHERITDNDMLLNAAEDARAQFKQKSLDSLTPYQRIVYEIVRDHGPLGPSEIHERYTEEVNDPRTKRTIRTYLEDGTVQPPRGGGHEPGSRVRARRFGSCIANAVSRDGSKNSVYRCYRRFLVL
jgi:Cdc6-like AAA superfamily ATPase